MPIYGRFMEKVYKDEDLGITKGPFKRPSRALSVEIDCDRYKNPDYMESDSLQLNQDPQENFNPGDIF